MATPASKTTTAETSVMVSLRELRAIDSARRADEQLARERAIADAARRAAEAEAARIARVAQQEAAREREAQRAREAEQAAAREAELRVREAEARARAAADAALAARRLDDEMQLRREQVSRTRPKAMLALLGVFAAAALGLGALYASRANDADELGNRLQTSITQIDVQKQRIDGLEKARVGTVDVIAGIRAQLLAVNRALVAQIHATTPPAIVSRGGHGHHGVPAVTPPVAPPATIDLGDCARQPLLCGK